MLDLPQVDLHVEHHFADGCYARELHIPAGVALVGAIHKTNHHWVLSKGHVIVSGGEGDQEYIAPYHGITQPGEKRAFYAVEDSVWTTFHPTTLTDINEIEKEILQYEGGL